MASAMFDVVLPVIVPSVKTLARSGFGRSHHYAPGGASPACEALKFCPRVGRGFNFDRLR